MKCKILLFTLAFVLFSIPLFSQDSPHVGISGTVQDNEFGILIPIRITEKFVLVPAFAVSYAEKIGTDFGIALAPRYYLKNSKIAPYIGLKFGALINKPSSKNIIISEMCIDMFAGVAFGGEYFLSENFSFGVEVQGNFSKSDKNSIRFGNPNGINFNTGTMISATIYF